MKTLVTVLALIVSFSAFSQQSGLPTQYKEGGHTFSWERLKISENGLESKAAAVDAAVNMIGMLKSGYVPSDALKTINEAIRTASQCKSFQHAAKAEFEKGRIIPNGFKVTSKFSSAGSEYFRYSLEVLAPCVAQKVSRGATRNYDQATWRF